MNCRTFENRLSDWLAGRLSADDAHCMDRHAAVCAICERAAIHEKRLRAAWQADKDSAASTVIPDLWPRLSTRLEDATIRERRSRTVIFQSRLALGAASLLLTAVLAGLSLRPDSPPPVTTPKTITATSTALLSVLPDVSRVDPAVDDPAGMSMKEEWRQINSNSVDSGDAR